MTLTVENEPYSVYIRSDAWLSQHSKFLKLADRRCACLPFLANLGKTVKGKYHHYNVHHMTTEAYERQGEERYGVDVIVLSTDVHKWIVHGILSKWKRPSQQKNYPNTAQKILHGWCRLPFLLKSIAIILMFAAVGYAGAGVVGFMGGFAIGLLLFI